MIYVFSHVIYDATKKTRLEFRVKMFLLRFNEKRSCHSFPRGRYKCSLSLVKGLRRFSHFDTFIKQVKKRYL